MFYQNNTSPVINQPHFQLINKLGDTLLPRLDIITDTKLEQCKSTHISTIFHLILPMRITHFNFLEQL